MSGVEMFFDARFGEGSSVQISPKVRRLLVKLSPFLAILSLVLCVLFVLFFWKTGHEINRSAEEYLQTNNLPNNLSLVWYVVFVGLVALMGLLATAIPHLAKRQFGGWSRLFYASILVAFLGILYLYIPGYGFANVIGSILIAGMALFALMQTRSYFS